MVSPAICHVSLPYMLIQISACNVLIQLVYDTNREIQQIGDEAFCSTTSTSRGFWTFLIAGNRQTGQGGGYTENYKRGNFQQREQRHVVLCILVGVCRVWDERSASILRLDSRCWH